MSPFRGFLTTSVLFIAAPLPLMACLAFKTGGWLNVLLALAGGLGLGLLYWWPIGAFLSWRKGRTWMRLLSGYLLSLPFYFLTLWVLYPTWGAATFHPFVNGRWTIYLTATPQFYGLVLLLFYLTTWRTARWTRRGAVVVFAVGVFLPLYLTATMSLNWPKRDSHHVVITTARIVDAPSGRIVDGQNVYVNGGRIVELGPESVHADWPRIEARGQYLLPGLIDVHTHLQSPIEIPAGFRFGYFMKSMMGDYSLQPESGVKIAISDLDRLQSVNLAQNVIGQIL